METSSSRPVSVRAGIALGALWSLTFISLAAIVSLFATVPNPAYRLFEWLARVLPGALLTPVIDIIVRTVHWAGAASTSTGAKQAEHAMAIGFAVAIGAGTGGVLAAIVRHRPRLRSLWGLATGALAAVLYLAIVARAEDLTAAIVPLTVVGFLAWGALLGGSLSVVAAPDETSPERRRVLVLVGIATAVTSVVALGLSRLLTRGRERMARVLGIEKEAALTSGAAASPPGEQLLARFMPVPGTRPELTDNADFYRIDINLTPPSINAATWRLEIAGLVAHPRVLTLDELRARPAISQIITLECISNIVGGDLIGTSRWTGIRLADLLDELGVAANARAVSFEAADGFHETASLADARDPRSLLVYAMNGEPLPEAHGFPLRLYIPDRHGMKLPKWIRRIEIVAEPRPGYWVERGWSATAIPHTTSVIDTVRTSGAGAERRLSLGGIAYAGARSISRVEVQLDDGPWQAAQLRAPALGPLTWVQWRLDAPYGAGYRVARVRAYDGRGELQETVVRPPHPDGATGLHAKKLDV